MAFNRDAMKQRAAALAAQGVYVGTSSWKYEGWLGQLYTPARYEYRGKVAKSRFERDCLAEYAEVFKTSALMRRRSGFIRSEAVSSSEFLPPARREEGATTFRASEQENWATNLWRARGANPHGSDHKSRSDRLTMGD